MLVQVLTNRRRVQELKQEVQDLRQVQARRRQEAAMRDQWEVSRMKGGLDTEILC